MKITLALLTTAALFWGTHNVSAQAPSPDSPKDQSEEVILRVNGLDITRHEQRKAVIRILNNRPKASDFWALGPKICDHVRSIMIEQKLVESAAAATKIKVSDDDIAIEFEKFKSQIPPGQSLDDVFASMHIDKETLTQDIRNHLTRIKLFNAKVKEVAKATTAEAQSFYANNPERFKETENVTASHILIILEESTTEEEKAAKKAVLQKIRSDILAKKITFEQAATNHSQCPSKKDSGNLGKFGKGVMALEFEEAAFSQEIGEVGGVIETSFGYHLIKVSEHSLGRIIPFSEISDQIIDHLTLQKKRSAEAAYIQKLLDNATIEELATWNKWPKPTKND